MPERPGPSTDRCAVCGTDGPVEVHHFAPIALFGAEADAWPVADLCAQCHDRWHRLVWRGP
jgi:predicted HNH restriction endonuclease